jgi:hypothetical protein
VDIDWIDERVAGMRRGDRVTMRISYSQSLRAQAVFAIGFDEPKTAKTSRHHLFAVLDWRMCSAIFSFACSIQAGRTPKEAFDGITWPEGK